MVMTVDDVNCLAEMKLLYIERGVLFRLFAA